MRRRDLLFGLGSLGFMPENVRARASAPEATPPPNGDQNAFAGMLALAPDVLAGREPPTTIAQLADVSAQLKATSVARPESGDGRAMREFARATSWMPVPAPVISDQFLPVFGFDLATIDRLLVTGEAPDPVTLFHGRFDEEILRTAWNGSGYTPVDLSDAFAYSFDPDGGLNLGTEVGSVGVGTMNNVALLQDNTLICTRTLAGLKTAVSAAQGNEQNLGAHPGISALVESGGAGLAAALITDGSALATPEFNPSTSAEDLHEILETEEAIAESVGTMPPVALALIGVSPGGPLADVTPDDGTPFPATPDQPVAFGRVSLLFDDLAVAEAALTVVGARIANGLRYSGEGRFTDLFSSWTLVVGSGLPVLTIDLSFAGAVSPRQMFDLFQQRDLGFVAW